MAFVTAKQVFVQMFKLKKSHWLANDCKISVDNKKKRMLNNLVGNMTKLSQQTKLQLAVVLDLCDHTKTLRSFLLRDAMHARYLTWACVCICHKSVFYRNGWTNRTGFWRVSFLLHVLHRVKRKFGYLQKQGHFPLEVCPKLRTQKISPRHIDRRNVLST